MKYQIGAIVSTLITIVATDNNEFILSIPAIILTGYCLYKYAICQHNSNQES